jgi:hypothetical protein
VLCASRLLRWGKRRAVQVSKALTRFCNCVGEAAHGAGLRVARMAKRLQRA